MKEKLKQIVKQPLFFYTMLAIGLNLVIEGFSRRSLIGMGLYLIQHPVVFILNTILILWTFSLVLLVRRKVFLTSIISILWIASGVCDFVLRSYRVTPFNASDIKLVKYAITVSSKYMPWYQMVLLIAAIVLVLVFCVLLFIYAPKSDQKPAYLQGGAAVVVTLFAVLGIVHVSMDAGILATKFGNLSDAYALYGLPYCFSSSVFNTGISKPEDYSEEAVAVIKNKEIVPEETVAPEKLVTVEANESNQETIGNTQAVDNSEKQKDWLAVKATENTPNIIFLQLESFFDVSRIEGITFSKDPIPYFHQLMEAYPSGYLSVPSVGAGTANTEFEAITGMNLDFFGPGEYPYKTILKKTVCESMAYDLKDLGYMTHAIHNNDGSFYDRHIVFSQLGFDTFTPIEYMNGYETTPMGWAKDGVLVKEIRKVLDSTDGADYVYTISVQGHGSYPSDDSLENKIITVSGMEDETAQASLEYYVNQIYEMDRFIRNLIRMLEQREEETILVMYGDHLPSLNLTDEILTNHNVFQTEYVVWSNFEIKAEDKEVEAYQLGAHVLDMLGLHIGTMNRLHQKYLTESDQSEESIGQYLDDMQILEYDILYGEQEIYDKEMPYEATDLQYGTYPVQIAQVWEKNQTLYVMGDEFTAYSVIYVNEKPYETKRVSMNMIYAEDIDWETDEVNTVEVRQVGEDKIELGGSNVVEYLYEEKSESGSEE